MKNPQSIPEELKQQHNGLARFLWWATVAVIVMVTPSRAATPTYTTIDFPGARDTEATGINDLGQIAGHFDATVSAGGHGFLLDHLSFTQIDFPGGAPATVANGINNLGQIVGYYNDAGGTHGFLLDHGSFTTVDVLGASGPPFAGSSFGTAASGINNFGQIVGFYGAGGVAHGFLWDHGSFTTITIDVPGATGGSLPFGINTLGQVVGFYGAGGVPHGFLATLGAVVPTLSSITVTPANPTIKVGQSQQFTAIGTFSDSTSRVLAPPGEVTWSSSAPAVATIDVNGLATGLSGGASTLTATSGGISGSTVLTVVNPTPSEQVINLILTINSLNLPMGTASSLNSQLANIFAALNAPNTAVRQNVPNQLAAFIKAVSAQKGKKLTAAQADALINAALNVLSSI